MGGMGGMGGGMPGMGGQQQAPQIMPAMPAETQAEIEDPNVTLPAELVRSIGVV